VQFLTHAIQQSAEEQKFTALGAYGQLLDEKNIWRLIL
jgi:hypothetical protein